MPKTILITGATDGIGQLAARKLAEAGHQLLLHGRNAAKLSEIAEQISGAQTMLADFSRMEEVAEMTDAVHATHQKIDEAC